MIYQELCNNSVFVSDSLFCSCFCPLSEFSDFEI